jgi:hypothetical protein
MPVGPPRSIAAIVGIEAPSPVERGFQIGQKAITIQWQDGKQVVVWPDELASGKPRFPTPPWNERLTSK